MHRVCIRGVDSLDFSLSLVVLLACVCRRRVCRRHRLCLGVVGGLRQMAGDRPSFVHFPVPKVFFRFCAFVACRSSVIGVVALAILWVDAPRRFDVRRSPFSPLES